MRLQKLALAAFALLALQLVPAPLHGDEAASERLVLAFYYAWFDEATWRSGTLSDLPQTPYNSNDREAIARHVDMAQQAGIDALVLNWWGMGNRTEQNLVTLLDVAAQKGLRVAVDFDLNSPVMRGAADHAANLRHWAEVHAAHPAYLRTGGRPVLFFYNVSRLSVSAWRAIRDQVDPERRALWIAEGTDPAYLAVFDGHHLYSITWPNRIAPAAILPRWGDRVRAYARDSGSTKLWVATVMPGYDDRLVRKGGFSRSRDGGDYYRQCWQAAIDSRADWVIVNSFNEWPEGTYVEPSRDHGSLYLDLTREWSARYKGADFSAVAATSKPKPAPAVGASPPAKTPVRRSLPPVRYIAY